MPRGRAHARATAAHPCCNLVHHSIVSVVIFSFAPLLYPIKLLSPGARHVVCRGDDECPKVQHPHHPALLRWLRLPGRRLYQQDRVCVDRRATIHLDEPRHRHRGHQGGTIVCDFCSRLLRKQSAVPWEATYRHISTLEGYALSRHSSLEEQERLVLDGGGGWLKQGLFGSWHSGFVVVIYSPTKADKPIPTS